MSKSKLKSKEILLLALPTVALAGFGIFQSRLGRDSRAINLQSDLNDYTLKLEQIKIGKSPRSSAAPGDKEITFVVQCRPPYKVATGLLQKPPPLGFGVTSVVDAKGVRQSMTMELSS